MASAISIGIASVAAMSGLNAKADLKNARSINPRWRNSHHFFAAFLFQLFGLTFQLPGVQPEAEASGLGDEIRELEAQHKEARRSLPVDGIVPEGHLRSAEKT